MAPASGNRFKPGWLAGSARRLQAAAMVMIGAVTMLGVYGIENAEQQRRHAALLRNAAEVMTDLQKLDVEQSIYLRAVAAQFGAQGTVTASDFAQLQRQLNFNPYSQGALGLGWAPRVAADQISRFIARQDPAHFHFRRDPKAQTVDPHGDVYPVVFLDPPTPENLSALGFDTHSEPQRRAAMDRAAAIDAPVATGYVTLVQDQGRARQGEFLIYMPVFKRGAAMPPRSAASHRPLLGYIYMPFRAPDLLAIAAALPARDHIHVAAYDDTVAPGRLMAVQGADGGGPSLSQRVIIGNRPWRVVISMARAANLSRLSQIIILSGLIVALLLAMLIQLTYRTIQEEQRVLEWRASEAGIRNSLSRELNHRVKNTLATVLSIIALTHRRETDLDRYVDSLSGRVRALSATHDLLTSNDWASIELRQIIVAELAPYIENREDQVTLDGPDIQLAPNDSLTLGLAVHELTTNAAKYGALSTLGGRIDVRWQRLSDSLVEMHWHEIGGPAVAPPSKRGFGRDLLERILARELSGPVKMEFAPDGLQCVFCVPLREAAAFQLRRPSA